MKTQHPYYTTIVIAMIPVNLLLQDIRAPVVAEIVTYVSRDISAPMLEMLQITFCNYCMVLVWLFWFFFLSRSAESLAQEKANHPSLTTCVVLWYMPSICPGDANINLFLVIFVHHVLNPSVVRYNSTEKKFGWMRVHMLHYGYPAPATKSTVAANGHPCP